MKKTETVAKAVWFVVMVSFTLWIIFSLYIPALAYLHSGMGVFGFILGLSAITLFTIAVWGFLGLGVSYIATALGFLLGFITEGIVALRNSYKRA